MKPKRFLMALSLVLGFLQLKRAFLSVELDASQKEDFNDAPVASVYFSADGAVRNGGKAASPNRLASPRVVRFTLENGVYQLQILANQSWQDRLKKEQQVFEIVNATTTKRSKTKKSLLAGPPCGNATTDCQVIAGLIDNYMVCNIFHEYSLLDLKGTSTDRHEFEYLTQGHFRSVWRFQDATKQKLILKVFHQPWWDDSSASVINMQKTESFINQKAASSSRYIAPMHGQCGGAILGPLAHGSLQTDASRFRKQSHNRHKLLKMAFAVMQSVADLHRSGMVHGDIHPGQWMRFDDSRKTKRSQYQMIDFNKAWLMTRNTTTNQNIPVLAHNNKVRWQSPEEVARKPVTEKADVWAAGSVLYYMTFHRQPFADIMFQERAKNPEQLPNLNLPTINKVPLEIRDPFVKAMNMTFVADPSQRATAQEVADVFKPFV